MSKTRVLFLCTGNYARSQIAEAFLRKYAGNRFKAHSAGLEPKGLHPLTVAVMEEAGVDMSGQLARCEQPIALEFRGSRRLYKYK